jgi:hypothetical protein
MGCVCYQVGALKQIVKVYNHQRGDVVPMAMHWRLGYHRVFTTWPKHHTLLVILAMVVRVRGQTHHGIWR